MNNIISELTDIETFDYYLSGPMSGINEYNFPKFEQVAEELRSKGHIVFSPHETFNGNTDRAYADYLRADTIAIAQCKNIMLLPGWRRSRGACYEYLIAKTLGLGIEKYKFDHKSDQNSNELRRIALLGYARTGKDTVGSVLVKEGYQRVAIGDIIKFQMTPIVQAHLGHSAFTENDELKENIRPSLVEWGYSNYENILQEFLDFVPGMAINTRLYRYEEARAWKNLEGAEIWKLRRPNYGAAEPKAKKEMDKILDAGLVDRFVDNVGSVHELEEKAAFLAHSE